MSVTGGLLSKDGFRSVSLLRLGCFGLDKALLLKYLLLLPSQIVLLDQFPSCLFLLFA